MFYHPCQGCTVDPDTCERRAEIKSAISGLSITSIKFKCHERTPLFKAGQRVQFVWSVYHDEYDEYIGDPDQAIFNGTIIKEVKGSRRFTVRVDLEGEFYDYEPKEVFKNGGDVVNVNASSLVALDEPSRRFCESCLKYEGEEGRCQAHPNLSLAKYIPYGCLDYKI